MNSYRTVTPKAHKRAQRISRGLGWFSIALGAAELLMPGVIARAVGLRGRTGLIRLYGVREIVTGIGILTADKPAPYVWARVAGDAMDIATLMAGFVGRNRRPKGALAALSVVARVTALDVFTARQLGATPQVSQPLHDYSDRSGLPKNADAMRGAATDFHLPPDLGTPAALRPGAASGSLATADLLRPAAS